MNVRVNKKIYYVVINKDTEMSYFTENNVTQIYEWWRINLQNNVRVMIQFFNKKRKNM